LQNNKYNTEYRWRHGLLRENLIEKNIRRRRKIHYNLPVSGITICIGIFFKLGSDEKPKILVEVHPLLSLRRVICTEM